MSIRGYVLVVVAGLSVCLPPCLTCPSQCQCVANKVNCAGAGLKSLPVDLPQGMIELNFTGNQLSYLGAGAFEKFSNLEVLDLSNNRISTVSQRALSGILKLLKLCISHNEISTLEPRSFIDIPKVHTIDLSHNPLKDLPRDVFTDTPWLSRLEVKGTQLNQGDFGEINMLTKLEYLDLSQNNFTHLPYLMMFKLSNLRNLYLSNSNIQTIDTNAFVGLRSLQTLVLSQNNIKSLNRESYQVMESLSFLDLSGNALSCSCGVAQFQDWLKQQGVGLISASKCKSAEDLDYDVGHDDLSAFCAGSGPTTNPPSDSCGPNGRIKLSVFEVDATKAEITWSFKSVPAESNLIGNLRIYEKENSESWYDFRISDKVHKFENLTHNSQYIFCVFQKDCVLYTCVDFSTQRDPVIGGKTDVECIPLETSLGLGVAAGAIILVLGIASMYFILKGVCCCPQKHKEPDQEVPRSPVRQTQQVIPMQISQSYVPSGLTRPTKRFQSITSDTYDAIPLEPLNPNHNDVFMNPGYKERPRHANDPLPPIGNTDDGSIIINGVSSCYLHPDNCSEQRSSGVVSPLPRPGVGSPPPEAYPEPVGSSVMRDESGRKLVQPDARHTINHLPNLVHSESDPYHLYSEAKDIDVDITPALPDKGGSTNLRRLFVANPSLEDLKKRLDGSTGKVKKFTRPKLTDSQWRNNKSGLARNRSFSTPDILALRERQSPELDGRDLKSDV